MTPGPENDVFVRVSECSLRLMAGMVPARTLEEIRGDMAAKRDGYPWEEVVDRILRDPVDRRRLLERGLRAQRDWIARGGADRGRRMRRVRTAGKRFLAYLLSRAIFFVLYTVAVVVLLVLVQSKWPELNIYRIPELVRQWFGG